MRDEFLEAPETGDVESSPPNIVLSHANITLAGQQQPSPWV
jgi:hypothetical protein